jgi:hypothetical protein
MTRHAHSPAEVRMVSTVERALQAIGYQVVPAAARELPHPALTNQGGGDVAADPRDQSGTKSANPEFELRVDLKNPGNVYVPGQRAYVRVTVDRKPLFWQWKRDLLQLIQSRKQSGNELAKY